MTAPDERDLLVFALYHVLIATSPDDGDRAGMVTLRLADGRYVGDVWLSTPDLKRITGQLSDDESDLPAVADADADDVVRAAEAFLRNGGAS
ncbi:hypothetical protein [Streptomyces rubrogriseus]|uniref:hypothetical protein n=1 Tax=Streptomyces rubrogriseus TaxID=194673 RepID=UPI000D58FA2D|nr:hypothetical protein [Streptomyces rubrogriseus]